MLNSHPLMVPPLLFSAPLVAYKLVASLQIFPKSQLMAWAYIEHY